LFICSAPAASAISRSAAALAKLTAMHGSATDGPVSLSSDLPNHSDILDMISHVAQREQFVFKQNQLDILAQSFAGDMHPAPERLEHIAELCNTSTEADGE